MIWVTVCAMKLETVDLWYDEDPLLSDTEFQPEVKNRNSSVNSTPTPIDF